MGAYFTTFYLAVDSLRKRHACKQGVSTDGEGVRFFLRCMVHSRHDLIS